MYGPEAVCRSRVPLLAEMLPHMGTKETMIEARDRNPRPELGPGDTLEAMVVSEPGRGVRPAVYSFYLEFKLATSRPTLRRAVTAGRAGTTLSTCASANQPTPHVPWQL